MRAHDDVPSGYWPALSEAIRHAPRLPLPDLSRDPPAVDDLASRHAQALSVLAGAPLRVPAACGVGLPPRAPRYADWPSRLEAVIAAARARPFDWTGHNCCTFAADCVEAITGVRHHDAIAPLMTSAARARRHGARLVELVDACLGAEARVPPSLAQRGDLLCVVQADGPVLAVCVGAQAVAVGLDGLQFGPMRGAQCAWRI